jgi:hypothetical protein
VISLGDLIETLLTVGSPKSFQTDQDQGDDDPRPLVRWCGAIFAGIVLTLLMNYVFKLMGW